MSFKREKIKDFYLLSTDVENIFINEYMPEAPGEYVKVYLYGLLYSQYQEDMTYKEMGKQLKLTSKQIEEAWDYWAGMGVIEKKHQKGSFSSEYDIEFKNLRSLMYGIENDGEYSAIDFSKFDIAKLTSEKVVDLLNASGISEFIRQRPYDIVPDTRITPRDIFVSAVSKMPLASDFGIVSKGREEFFSAGIEAFAKIAPVHIGISPEQNDSFISKISCADINIFKGPNPSGNVGVQINNTYPVNKGDIVWTIGAEEVIFFGKLLLTGRLDFTRRIALAGAEVKEPQYYNIVIGSRLTPLLEGKLKHTEHIRVINGNPLVGKKAAIDGYLSAKSTEVTVIPEGDDVNELLGWISPRLNEFSTSHSYLSWLFPKKKYNLDARIKGGERHIIMSGEYDRVFPMDIYAGYLVKAIIAKDIDRMEGLGIYEVAPEDFAVAEFVDSSKLELQRIVREGLDYLRSEMS